MIQTVSELPQHLKKYVVDQNYEKYTPEDQAVWRYILRQLKDYLSQHAHECYVEGLKKTGITIDTIPKIEDMSDCLNEFGWKAVPVSGFIPPAAFMEFQSRGILPIASDMRTLDHLLYTPAPDIVHEAAGHAPILVNAKFAGYLKKYASVAKNAIISKEDYDQYEAIRVLSDIKENPESSPEEIEAAEKDLEKINASMTGVSEAGWLSRMNWWTAEYGLIGDLNDPQIFGAGLLSSVGEAQDCLKPNVKKIPLSVECIETSYDITEPQPQLFVTPDFDTLHRVLDDLAEKMAFKKGGKESVEKAIEAKSINTIELDSGIQISGVLERAEYGSDGDLQFLKFSGPSQLNYNNTQIPGHGKDHHIHGYSTPLGKLAADSISFSELNVGKNVQLKYASGIVVEGKVAKIEKYSDSQSIYAFENCSVTWKDEILFAPDWGIFDLICGAKASSVFGGPADRIAYGETDDFVASRVPARVFSSTEIAIHNLYQRIRDGREQNTFSDLDLPALIDQWQGVAPKSWLLGVELYELSVKFGKPSQHILNLLEQFTGNKEIQCIKDGIRIAAN